MHAEDWMPRHKRTKRRHPSDGHALGTAGLWVGASELPRRPAAIRSTELEVRSAERVNSLQRDREVRRVRAAGVGLDERIAPAVAADVRDSLGACRAMTRTWLL
jgi:hypothetical protein